jgi:low temperature requirement protein LtrA
MTDRSEQKRLVAAGFRRWFRTPPRRHGEVEYSREVSFLELFYDLVYVVLIAQIAHHLAEHVNWAGVRDFAVVFGLIWLAWMNGTLWHELHSREDGRSRNYIFIQMMLLALLAVFAGEATGDDGSAFAITYAVLFSLYTWQWYLIHRIDDPVYHRVTNQYLAAMVITVSAAIVSAFVDDGARLAIWATVVVVWVVGGFFRMRQDSSGTFSIGVTGSLVERFGLFTIIVLGEVVVGVVEGIGEAEDHSIRAVATGIIALHIGYGFWWNYFDTLGRRVPAAGGGRLAVWFFSHLPLTMAIAGAGAAMVSLVEHAADARTPAPTAWLLTGSVTVVLAGIVFAARALSKDEFPPGMLEQLTPTLALAATAVLVIGAARPAPIVLVIAVGALLYLTWFRMFALYLAGGGRLSRGVDGGLPTD